MRRREFLSTSFAAAAACIAPRSARAADARIEVLTEEPIGVISPELHGHFTEHIGGVVYDGIWVGEGSSIPNVGGIRKALVDHMMRLNPPVVRWPGGCFADSYNWRDGIGPRDRRPRHSNFWVNDPFMRSAPDGPQKYEPNQFGTDDFVRFCRLTGAQPYIAANVRSGRPDDFDQWVEYCNSPAGSTSLADMRAAAGGTGPYGVRYWGVGNESWGCGGNFTPEEYAVEYRRFTAWIPDYGVGLRLIGSGANSFDFEWTRRLMAALAVKGRGVMNSLWGLAFHYYCGTTGNGQAVDFTVDDWYELLKKADQMESLIDRHWFAMSEADPRHQTKLVIDEWGAWHKPGTEVHPAFLFGQMPTLRDALISALTLDTFHRHADKIAMANVAQLINNLHCLFLAHEDRFVATPNYHVFEMYKGHQGASAVRMVAAAPAISFGESRPTLWGLAGSASVREKRALVTVVNPHAGQERECEIALRGAAAKSCRARTLSSSDIHAHNTFSEPHALEPKSQTAPVSGPLFVWRFPPASVTALELELA